jgi:hypothetical protein
MKEGTSKKDRHESNTILNHGKSASEVIVYRFNAHGHFATGTVILLSTTMLILALGII